MVVLERAFSRSGISGFITQRAVTRRITVVRT